MTETRPTLTETERIASRPRVVLIVAAAVIAAGAIAWVGGRSLAPRLVALVADPDRVGPWAPFVFILAYSGAVVALVPATPFSLAAGALFGIVHGVAYSFVGATIGSTCAFLLGRHGARRLVEERLARMPRFAAVERAAAAKGRRIVFLLRLSPVVPFNFLNYALGLTTMSVWDFMLAGTGSIPGEVLYAYWGRISGEALALAEQAGAPKSASYYGFLVVGLIATAAATAVVTTTARRALRDV